MSNDDCGLPYSTHKLGTYLFVNGELPRLDVGIVLAIFTRHRKHRSKLLRGPSLLRPELRKLLLLVSGLTVRGYHWWSCLGCETESFISQTDHFKWTCGQFLLLLLKPSSTHTHISNVTYRVRGRITDHHHCRALLVVDQRPELAQSFVQGPLGYDVLTWLRVTLVGEGGRMDRV